MTPVTEVLRTTGEFLRVLPTLMSKPKGWDFADSIGLRVQQQADKRPHSPCLVFEGQRLNWQQFNALANQVAHALATVGVGRGDCVAVLMENRLEQLATVVGIAKLGAIAGLINTNLRGAPLIHCVSSTQGVRLVLGSELAEAAAEVRDDLGLRGAQDLLWWRDGADADASCPGWATDFGAAVAAAADHNRPETSDIRRREPAMYIFTSGTTGMPKAAVLGHGRYLNSAISMKAMGVHATPRDRIYICLPLYHGTGLLVGVGPAIISGACIVLRRKFSASNFLAEVREHQCTVFVYIGELCRYLLAQPEQANDADNPLRKVVGNGLRPDIWHSFKARFGIKRVAEFYGASEGNAGFLNVLNKDCTVGLTPSDVKLLRYDLEADALVRGSDGYAIEAALGEPGLMVARIDDTAVFEGYTNKEATEKKILRSLCAEGDAWFDSGDLMKTVDVGFAFGQAHYQFVDRLGDTFRWKGENCSTNEVGELINDHPDVAMANVYGVEVPGADGRAGMAALLPEQGRSIDMDSLSAQVMAKLPAYARPVFLRLLPQMEVTGTFKLVKGELREQAYHPDKCPDPVWVLQPGSSNYQPLDASFYGKLQDGSAGY